MRQTALLQILADGKYHSGDRLGKALGISRAAVCKIIHQIEQQTGLDIYAVKGKGYCLSAPLQLLDKQQILEQVSARVKQRLQGMELFASIDSTNRYLNEKLRQGTEAPWLVMAESQLSGQGRRGRQWVSPFACNIYLSLLWRFACGPAQLGCLSLLVAMAVVKTLRKNAIAASVKWPNDIFVNDKKIAGILLEMRGEADGPSLVVIGIGINVAMQMARQKDIEKIDQLWTDVASVTGKSLDRNQLTAELLDALFELLEQLPEQQKVLLQHWQTLDMLYGENVEVCYADRTITGKAMGITEQGALKVHHRDREILCYSGDVSIRRQNKHE